MHAPMVSTTVMAMAPAEEEEERCTALAESPDAALLAIALV